MEIQEVSVDKLIPYIRNPRKNDHAVSRMVASIKEFGFKIPLLVRRRGQQIEVVDGHLRLKAAQKLEMTAVPVIFCDEWSEAQVKAFRLLVNRSVTWADWDEELLAIEMGELKDMHIDLALTGFDSLEIDTRLFHKKEEPGQDVLPELKGPTVAQAGDMWFCDPHYVLNGDATSATDVGTLLAEAKPILLLTDPPFGVSLDAKWRERAGLGPRRQTGTIPNDDRVDWEEAYRLFSGDVAYIFHAGIHAAKVAAGLEAAGFEIRAQIIWVKQHFALSRGDFHWRHECAWYAIREGKSSHWCGDRKQSTVWEVPNLNAFGGSRDEVATGHGAQKPVELMRRAILNNTRCGEIIYDPFLGSGSSLVAAQLTGRVCYGLEIDLAYVDLIVTRWQNLTGKDAVLKSDGRTFRQVSEERRQATEVPACPAHD